MTDPIPSSARCCAPSANRRNPTKEPSIQCRRIQLCPHRRCSLPSNRPTSNSASRTTRCRMRARQVHGIARRRQGHLSALTTRWAGLWVRCAVWDVGADHCGGRWAQRGGRVPARAQSGRQFPMGARHARGPGCVCPSPPHCRDSALHHPSVQPPRRAKQRADGRGMRMNSSIEPRWGPRMGF